MGTALILVPMGEWGVGGNQSISVVADTALDGVKLSKSLRHQPEKE